MMKKIHQYVIMSAPTCAQYGAIEAMRHCDEEIEKRKSVLKPIEKGVPSGVLSRYKKYSKSASEGAVIEQENKYDQLGKR